LLAFGLILFVLGDVAVRMSSPSSHVAAWWPAAGVSVAVLVRRWQARWSFALAIVIFSGLGNLAGGRPWYISLGFSLSNAAEALVAAACLWQLSPRTPSLRRLGDVARLGAATALGAATIAGGVALTLWVSGETVAASTLRVIPSHAASVLLIAPLALSSTRVTRRHPAEVAASWLVIGAAVGLVFSPGQTRALVFLLMVPMVWSGIRLGVRAVSAQLLAVGIAVTVMTSRGWGPFANPRADAGDSNASIQLLIIACSLVAVSLATAMAERESALQRVRASEELFRRGFDEALVGMMLLRLEGKSVRALPANNAATRELAIDVNDLVSPRLRDDEGRTLGEVAHGLAPGEGWRGEMDHVLDGSRRRLSVSVSRLSGDAARLATCQTADVTARHQADLELERLAMRDHLTGLPNRVLLDQRLSTLLAEAATASTSVAVMFIDLDDFKLINDTSGHHQGDLILVEIARRLAACVRPDDTVARMGGDEFVVICPDVSDMRDAVALADRLRPVCQEPISINDSTFQVELSVGIALSTPDVSKNELLSQADIALYSAKAGGKRRIVAYTDDMGAAAADQVRLEADLRDAVDGGQLAVHMQPVVDVDDERIMAAEALIRWNHPERGLLLPGAFLPVAERAGMMVDIGAWVLDEACRQAASWIEQFGVDAAPCVHVNVSARQLDERGFADIALATLRRRGLPPHKLVLELTETYLAEVDESLIAEFEILAGQGVRFAADDYGTGYSPLTRIIELPISMIKIDQRFVRSATDNQRALAVVSSLANLARSLGLEAVAEGVESVDHARVLRDMGIRSAQGHLWYRAMSATAFHALLNQTAASRISPADAPESLTASR